MDTPGEDTGIASIMLDLGARCGWAVNAKPQPLYLGQRAPVPTVQESWWAPEPLGTETKKKSLTPDGV